MNSNRIRMLFYHHYLSGIKQSFTSTQNEGRGWLAFCTVACLLVISWTSCLAGAEALTTIMTICDKLLSRNTSMFLDPVGRHDSSLYTIQLLHYYPHLAWIQNNYSLYFLQHPAFLARRFFFNRKWRLSGTLSRGTYTVHGRRQQDFSLCIAAKCFWSLTRVRQQQRGLVNIEKSNTKELLGKAAMEGNKILWLKFVH